MNTNRKSFLASLASLFVLPRFMSKAQRPAFVPITVRCSESFCTADVTLGKQHEFLSFVFQHATEFIRRTKSEWPDQTVVGVTWHKDQGDRHGWKGYIRLMVVPSNQAGAWLAEHTKPCS